jgi:hypothetical protein
VSTVILLWVMLQTGGSPGMERSPIDARPMLKVPDFPQESPADLAAYQERDFIQRLNGLSKALSAFTETYKGGEIDLKKVKALRKALHELEKSSWFRPQKEEK